MGTERQVLPPIGLLWPASLGPPSLLGDNLRNMFIALLPFLVCGNYVLLSIYGSMAALTFVHKGIEKAKLKGGEKDEDHAHLVVRVRKKTQKRLIGKASKKKTFFKTFP